MSITVNGTGGLTFNDASVQSSAAQPQIMSLAAIVASSALTITLNPCSLAFRSATLGTGTPTYVTAASALTLVVPSTATLGTVSAVQSRLIVIALNNAGTMELAVVNIAGGNDLTETGVISTTAISSAATSASVVYSTSARTSVAYRVVGYIESTQTTAGTWATAPSTIQGYGGQALVAMSSLGYGQTWQTQAKSFGVTYYNTSGKPIQVSVIATATAAAATMSFTVNGLIVSRGWGGNTIDSEISSFPVTIPVGASYSISITTGTGTLVTWYELR